MISEKDIVENLNRCPSFDWCNKNLCPLDLKLDLRVCLRGSDKCKWMRKAAKPAEFKGKLMISGGVGMPDVLLKFVPESNFKWLNIASKKRWEEING